MEDVLSNIIIKDKTSNSVKYRIGAAILDYLIFIVFFFFFVFTFGEKITENTHQIKGPLAMVPLIFWFIYFIVFEFALKGSPGNRIMGLKVLSVDNEPLKFVQIVKRRICDVLDIWWCFGLLGLILIKNTANNQRLGDIWAKTIVVRW